MGHFVLLHRAQIQGAPERPAAAERHLPEQVHSSHQETGEAAVSEHEIEQERDRSGPYQGIEDNEGADVVLVVDTLIKS